MGDISTDRLERLTPVLEPADQRQRDAGSRPRRPAPPRVTSEPDAAEGREDPPHQVDDMA